MRLMEALCPEKECGAKMTKEIYADWVCDQCGYQEITWGEQPNGRRAENITGEDS